MMKNRIVSLLALVASTALLAGPALPAGIYTNGLPVAGGSQYPSTLPLTGNETIPADTNLPSGQNPATEAITTNQLASFGIAQPNVWNALIGGDAGTNLWQAGTTGASETTTYAYGGPDQWAYWSGTNTAMTVSRANTAAALPSAYQYTFRMQRTASQTGVVQMCMAQEVESVNAIQFQGTIAELDFHAYTGANFSAANQNMTAYIIYGTSTDEGMQKMAWGLNAGGGGSSGWTGQANATAAVISLGAVSTAGRYAAIANIPATATELGVALCYTPVGTAGTTDAVYFAGIQLVRNNANAAYASTTVGYNSTQVPLAGFQRRPQQVETALQQRYLYTLNEANSATTIQSAAGTVLSTTTCRIWFPFPVPMRAAPTYANALSGSTFLIAGGDHADQALSTPFSATEGANTVNAGSILFTTGATLTQFWPCTLSSTASGSGVMQWTAQL